MKVFRLLNLVLAAGLAAAAAGCGDHHGGGIDGVDELDPPDCEKVPKDQPFVSDESWMKFVEAEAAGRVIKDDDCRAPALTTPMPGSALDRNVAPTFALAPLPPACAGAELRLEPRTACPPARGGFARFWRMISPIGVAYAHCPAVEGTNYVLRVKTPDGTKLYTALIAKTTFKPSDEIWKKTVGGRGGQTVHVTIQRAVFLKGNIMEGPFEQRQPFSFTIAP